MSADPTTITDLSHDDAQRARIATLRHRLRVAVACGVGVAAFWFVAGALGVPRVPAFSSSLFQEPTPILAIAIVALLYLASAILGSIIGGDLQTGLLAASAGLITLSARCGAARQAIVTGAAPSVFIRLALETLALGAIAGIAAAVPLPAVMRRSAQPRDSIQLGAAGLFCASLLTTALVLLLCRSDAKLQSLGSIGLSAFLASMITTQLVPLRCVRWLVAAPVLAGVAGFLGTYYLGADDWMIGIPRGFFAPLARALPVDFVGAGVAGIVLGFRPATDAELERG